MSELEGSTFDKTEVRKSHSEKVKAGEVRRFVSFLNVGFFLQAELKSEPYSAHDPITSVDTPEIFFPIISRLLA